LGLSNPAHTRHAAFLAGVGDCILELREHHPNLYDFIANELILTPYDNANQVQQPMDRSNFHEDIHACMNRVRANIDTAKTKGMLQNTTDEDLKKMFPSAPVQLLHKHKKLQKTLSNLEQDLYYRNFFDTLDNAHRAVNLSESSTGASGFLHAVPSAASLFMPNDNFRAAVRDRLMIPPLNGPIPECTLAHCPLAHLSTQDQISHPENCADTATALERARAMAASSSRFRPCLPRSTSPPLSSPPFSGSPHYVET
jgi:hypothetical protein